MKRLHAIDILALGLLIIGGINWGIVGVFNIDLVAYLLGKMSVFSRIIYIIVGVSALYLLAIAYCLRKK